MLTLTPRHKPAIPSSATIAAAMDLAEAPPVLHQRQDVPGAAPRVGQPRPTGRAGRGWPAKRA
eukprot:scaffold36955_cov69-Phaeocystis_antarctica.AAC.10